MDLSKIYSVRPPNIHKGAYGSVLVVCGSRLYSGSATLAAVSAVRAGADVVTIASVARAADIAANTLPDLITLPLKGSHITSSHIADIMDVVHVRRVNSVVIGCGLGVHQATLLTINKLIAKFTVPLVIDADGLRAIAKNPGMVFSKHCVLTPHLGELAILLGVEKINDDFDARLMAAKQAAAKYRSVVLLKGNVDIVTDGVMSITNNTGTPFMTKGGFGDTLSGICGALLARGVGLIEAANAAAYINGKAGELAAEVKGEGLAASDIFEYLPKVILG